MTTRISRAIVWSALLLLAACAVSRSFVEEARTMKSTQAAFNQSKHDIYHVYSEALKRQPDLIGKTIFRIVVSADGIVVQSTVVETTLDDKAVNATVNDIIRGMDFGSVRQPESVVIHYPIEFLPKK